MNAIIGLAKSTAIARRCEHIVRQSLRMGSIAELGPDTNFAAHLRADSLDMVTIQMSAEEEFGISISDDDAATIETLAAMVELVERLMRQRCGEVA